MYAWLNTHIYAGSDSFEKRYGWNWGNAVTYFVGARLSRKVTGSILDEVIGLFNTPGVNSASNRNEYQESLWGWKEASSQTYGPLWPATEIALW
jgi:hypothetical protein